MFGLEALRWWSPRRWMVAVVAAVGSALAIGLPTDVIPNPVFGRQGTPVAWWSYPILAVTALLSGLLLATYVRNEPATQLAGHDAASTVGNDLDRPGKVGGIGGLLTFFAVGCPICNKVVLIALGTAGALKWFAPVQPYLGAISLGLLAWALVVRLRGEVSCPIPAPVDA